MDRFNSSASAPAADLDSQFRDRCLHYCDLLERENLKARPFSSSALPLFSQLTNQRKEVALQQLNSALTVFEGTLAEGSKLRDNRRTLWRAMNILGMVPQPDIFDKISQSDVLTLYNTENVLVFQSLNFFDFVSVTIEQLYCSTWVQMTRREVWALQELVRHATAIFSGQKHFTYDPELREHYCEEVGTDELLKFYIHIRYISPMMTDSKVSGALVLNACRKWDGVTCASPLA